MIRSIYALVFTIPNYWDYLNSDPTFQTLNIDQSQILIPETTKITTLVLKTTF